MTKIFISHSVKDNDFARQIAQALTEVGIDVWIDLADIPAGMKWSTAVQNGLNECDAMVVIITPDSMASNNVEDEWQYYFDKRKKVFPIRWKPAEVHFQLNRIQYVDFHEKLFTTSFARLCMELQRQGVTVGGADGRVHEIHSDKKVLRVEDALSRPFAWIEIPAGEVTLEAGGYLKSATTFSTETFAIAKYPVTNAQFAEFITAGGYQEKKWWTEAGWQRKMQSRWMEPAYWKDEKLNGMEFPVVGVSWYEAFAFCYWLSAASNQNITLPTEQQWQYAAQGSSSRAYPMGQ